MNNSDSAGANGYLLKVGKGEDILGHSTKRIQNGISISYILVDSIVEKRRLDVRIIIESDNNAKYSDIKCSLYGLNNYLEASGNKVNLAINELNIIEFTLFVKNLRLWSPEDPFLYDLLVDVNDEKGNNLISEKKKIGIRKIDIRNDMRIYLNDRPIFLRGNTWVPTDYAAIPFEPSFCRKMLIEQKKQGFNYIRHHSTVPPDWYLDMTDELGLLISIEMGFDLEKSREILHRYYNHPSIIFWGGVNEEHNTGKKQEVKAWYDMIKEVKPDGLVYDCSGWGEYDRDTTDVLDQHFGYVFPYLEYEDMYALYLIYQYEGSVKGIDNNIIINNLKNGTFRLDKPQIVHELQGNAHVYSNEILMLDTRMRRIWEAHDLDYSRWNDYVTASQRYAGTLYKLQFEAVRRVDHQNGYSLLTVADSVPEFYHSRRGYKQGDLDITGTCNALGESKPFLVDKFSMFNFAHAVLIDTHCKPRTLWDDECINATVLVSCFDYAPPEKTVLLWRLKDGKKVIKEGSISDLEIKFPGVGKVCDLDIKMYEIASPEVFILEIEINGFSYKVYNEWNFWVFPRNKIKKPLTKRIHTNIKWVYDLGYATDYSDKISTDAIYDLLISDKLGNDELNYMNQGGKLLLLQEPVKDGISCTPSTYRNRMYHPWIGHCMGTIVHEHPSLSELPHEGFNDLQFYQVLYRSNRLMLDDLPVKVTPVLECVPVLEQSQAAVSGYLFETGIGKGKMLASGLNLKGAVNNECTALWLIDGFIKYCTEDNFKPACILSREDMEFALSKMKYRVWPSSLTLWLYNAEGILPSEKPIPNFLLAPGGGTAKSWIEPQGDWGQYLSADDWGLHGEGKATDGYRAHYWQPSKLPADIGIEWEKPVIISSITIEFVDELSIPADDGWELQIYENDKWNSIHASFNKNSSLEWKLNIENVSLTKFRMLFTKMNQINTDAVNRNAYPGGFRSGYPFPITWNNEKPVVRIRTLDVEFS